MLEEDRALAQALDRMEGGKFIASEQKATIEALRAYVKSLRGIAADLLSHHRSFGSVQEEYRQALAAAPSRFRDASRLFLDYAAEEPFYEIKRDYERLAQDWLTLATHVERRASEVERDDRTRDWGDTLRYVERTALFLERLDAHLESFPINLDSGEIRERHLADLKAYIDGFEALRKHLGTYREKLRNGAVSPQVREDLATAARKPIAPTIPVAFVPNDTTSTPSQSATQAPPPPPSETYACFLESPGQYKSLRVNADRAFEAGETFRLDVQGEAYGTVVVCRTVKRFRAHCVLEVDFSTRPLPGNPRRMTLVRLPLSTPPDSQTITARR
jgi:hypothetical protein